MTDEQKFLNLLLPGLAPAATTKAGGLTGEEFAGDVTGAELAAALEPALRRELRKLLEPTATPAKKWAS